MSLDPKAKDERKVWTVGLATDSTKNSICVTAKNISAATSKASKYLRENGFKEYWIASVTCTDVINC